MAERGLSAKRGSRPAAANTRTDALLAVGVRSFGPNATVAQHNELDHGTAFREGTTACAALRKNSAGVLGAQRRPLASPGCLRAGSVR